MKLHYKFVAAPATAHFNGHEVTVNGHLGKVDFKWGEQTTSYNVKSVSIKY